MNMKKFSAIILILCAINLVSAQCFKKIYAGYNHFIAINQDGTLWAWGKNTQGQLGDGSTVDKITPVQISSDTNWVHISSGSSGNLAIKSNGTLWAWGYNAWGNLGNGSSGGYVLTPTQIGLDTDWKEASLGYYASVALKTNGTLWTWGNNSYGYLGNGSGQNYQILIPTQVGIENNWKSVSGRQAHVLALKEDNTLWAWGQNIYGQLGIGTSGSATNSYTPIQVGSLSNWKWIETNYNLSYAIQEDNTLWIWGHNASLGINHQTQPAQIDDSKDWKTLSIDSHDGYDAALLVKLDGTLWAWGNDLHERLGNGSQQRNYQSPTQIGTDSDWESVGITNTESNAIKTDGTFWAWGKTALIDNGTTSVPTQYNCSNLSVSHTDKMSPLHIYPNPAKDIINFSETIDGELFNSVGQKVRSFKNVTYLDVSTLPKGIYILQTAEKVNKKIIIK